MTDIEALSYFYTQREEIEEIKYLTRPFANLLGVYFSPSIERANVIVPYCTTSTVCTKLKL